MENIDIITFALVFIRVAAVVFLMPVLGHKLVPKTAKIIIILGLTMATYSSAAGQIHELPKSLGMALLIIQEIMVGAGIAIISQVIFSSIQIAGQLISYQSGLAMANIIDPNTHNSISPFGVFIIAISMLVWLALDAHHTLILGLMESIKLIPIGEWAITSFDVNMIIDAGRGMFIAGLQIAAPALLLITLIYVALAIMSKAVPQIQVFFISFPLTLGAGIFVLGVSLPAIIILISQHYGGMGEVILEFIQNGASK